MEKRHRCKLCFRNFANGRALGGHMRSHMMKFYDDEAKKEQNDDVDESRSIHSFSSTSISPSSSSSSDGEDDGDGEEVKGPSMDHGFYVALQDRESETESLRKKDRVCGKRSKRVSKSRATGFDGFFQAKKKVRSTEEEEEKGKNSYEQSSVSSISDATPEEHVARCLIMLSRDNWRRAEVEFHEKEGGGFEEDDEGRKFGYCGNSGVGKAIKAKVRGKYRCEECNKLFKSYQALGGHRASHKKVKAENRPHSGGGSKAGEEKSHECPFCHRIFSSGQALGGHKRTHFIGSGANLGNVRNAGSAAQNTRNGEVLNIDLNLPAPVDDEENSQIAVSAVSDAEFVHHINQL